MWYAGKPIGLGVGPIFSVVWRYIVASLLAGVASQLSSLGLTSRFSSARRKRRGAASCTCLAMLYRCFYLCAIVSLYRGFGPLERLLGLFREMVSVCVSSKPLAAGRKSSVDGCCFSCCLSVFTLSTVTRKPGRRF